MEGLMVSCQYKVKATLGAVVAFWSCTFVACAADMDVTWWAVPAMSEEQRLPDVVPTDGEKCGTVRIVGAKDEYEPGSFVVRASCDLGKISVSVGALRDEKGRVFPADKVDLKVVKVWYQNRNGWFTYFADNGLKLCPELLLNDEDLIRVDTERTANYARLTEKDGHQHEWWLTPPHRMNRRDYNHYETTYAFQPMRENFKDAKSLRPVTLSKNVSKQFFLTVHVTSDVDPGLYCGSIYLKRLTGEIVQTIPVALRVLDFELPKPMSYRNQGQEFLVSSYNYSDPGRIAQENGGEASEWKLFEKVLRNQAEHGQTIHWMYGARAGANSTERTIDTMARAGMRTDILMGGVSLYGEWNTRDPQMMAVSARLQSEYYDRTRGHHNIYCNYDDEPGYGRLKADRAVFEPYKSYGGFKFALAAQNCILWKCGHYFDWHNTASDPTDATVPGKWNELGDYCHSAWYAQAHVGTENPAFNRRQYGLAAYLSGYSAVCNYAHHYGPYNDIGDGYKPMVFAYGAGSGVIDTLAWEGFREGIDDIRYATLLCALARVALESDDAELRWLGGRAKLFLAAFQRECDDLNMARGEMIHFISKLREALGNRANIAIAPKREAPTARKPLPRLPDPGPCEIKSIADAGKLATEWQKRNNLEKAVQVYLDLIAKCGHASTKDAAVKEVANLYVKWFQRDKAVEWLLAHGKRLEAADLIDGRDERAEERAIALRQDVFLDKKEPNERRAQAWNLLLRTKFAEEHLDEFVTLRKPQQAATDILSRFSKQFGSFAYIGDWKLARKALAWADRAEGTNASVRTWNVKTATYAAQACYAVGDREGALDYVDRGLKTAEREAARDQKKAWKPIDIYALRMLRTVLSARGGEKELTAAFVAANAEFGIGIKPAERKDRLETIGSVVMCAGDEARVRAVNAALQAMVRPYETKVYLMRYSPEPVSGLGGWALAASRACPKTEKLDRPFGGDSMQFLETDVTSGDRGDVQKDLSKVYERSPEWQALFDDWGVHFRLEIFDEKAKEIAMGLVAAGSLEGYIAPGENTPYVCLLHSLRPGGFSVYNTLYDQPGHRRINVSDRVNCREEIRYGESSLVLYWAFSWQKFATKIPTDGFCWDFEPCLWGRKACCTWNGLKTIHGRSSWGKLRFEMPENARLAIMKHVLAGACARYKREKISPSNEPEGIVEHWSDPEVGDMKFYDSVLKPIVTRLDAAADKVSYKMDPKTVSELEREALPEWHDFRFVVGRLRADYLRREQTQPNGMSISSKQERNEK